MAQNSDPQISQGQKTEQFSLAVLTVALLCLKLAMPSRNLDIGTGVVASL